MEMIYNSPHFCVVEFAEFEARDRAPGGGFEIMDKTLRREIFLRGDDAAQFRASVRKLIAAEPSVEEVDEFLGGYAGLMTTPLALH